VHIFDLEKTVQAVSEAVEFLGKAVGEGKRIVIVGTKRQAKEVVRAVGSGLNVGIVTERWLGGTITNWNQIKSRIDRLAKLKSDKLSGKLDRYTKKERLLLDREIEKLERFYGGLAKLSGAPEVLVVIDTHKERVAVREARNRKITVIGVVDSNANPDLIDYPIPMNDDSAGAIEMVIGALGEAIAKGNKGVEKVEKVAENEMTIKKVTKKGGSAHKTKV
jgi:small subunit ribosomal protein S2